jgi:hypothetical protein
MKDKKQKAHIAWAFLDEWYLKVTAFNIEEIISVKLEQN